MEKLTWEFETEKTREDFLEWFCKGKFGWKSYSEISLKNTPCNPQKDETPILYIKRL